VSRRFSFGEKSRGKLLTCAPALASVLTRAIELSPIDFTIVHGFRNQAEQDLLFASGASQKRWPLSTHNIMMAGVPYSHAADIAPWIGGAIPWKDTHAFAVLAGVMFAAANERGVELRWGGDWNRNGSTKDQSFMDWGHFELFG